MLHVERVSNGNHNRVFFNQITCGLECFGLGFFLFLCNSCLYFVLIMILQCILKFKLFQWEEAFLYLKKKTNQAAFTLESANKGISNLALNLFQTGKKYPFEACREICRCGWLLSSLGPSLLHQVPAGSHLVEPCQSSMKRHRCCKHWGLAVWAGNVLGFFSQSQT